MDDLEQLRQRFLDGDKSAILEAMVLCNCVHKVAAPAWLSDAFAASYKAAKDGSVRSWDDVFERPLPKGTHLKQFHYRKDLTFSVWCLAAMIRAHADAPIDDALFERIGEIFGIGRRLAKELYYAKKNEFGDYATNEIKRIYDVIIKRFNIPPWPSTS
jgi:hypothetical protein